MGVIMVQLRLAIVALACSGGSAFAGCCGPPPTTPGLAWEMPFLGQMDPSDHLQRSFDSGKQGVGAAPWSEYWYKFTLVTPPQGNGTGLTGFVATGFQSTITVLDNNLHPLGPINASGKLHNGNYYIHVTAPGHTFFHFGVVAIPPIADYPNTAGHTEATATNLGTLQKVISHGSSFYTYFTRIDPPIDSTTQGSLAPNFGQPNPNPPLQTDFYTFQVTTPGPVRLTSNSGPFGEPITDGPKYIVKFPNGEKAVWSTNQTKDLVVGTYLLQVVDQRTQVASGNVTVRNAQFEDFELYTFELLFRP
jgi:hypothetical protein